MLVLTPEPVAIDPDCMVMNSSNGVSEGISRILTHTSSPDDLVSQIERLNCSDIILPCKRTYSCVHY